MTDSEFDQANGFPSPVYTMLQTTRYSHSTMMLGMARVGISSMLKGSKMIIHKVLKKLDDRSLASILDFIEEIIHEPES